VTVSQVNTEVLDRCRQAAAAEAGHLGGAGDTFPDGGCAPTTFGELNASTAMATAVDALDRRIRAEFTAAERLLRSVEQAIGAVESGVRDVDDQAARGLTGTVA
jgi:hypothetical protein